MLKTLDQNDDIRNNDFVVPDTICVIAASPNAASPNSSNTVWSIRI